MGKIENVPTTKVSTQKSLSLLVLLGRCLLIFPVPGNPVNKFKWVSPRTIISLLLIAYVTLVTSLQIHRAIYQKKKIPALRGIIFHITIGISGVCFLNAAKRWQKLMKEWNVIDASMKNYEINENVNVTMRIVVGVNMVLGIGQNIAFMLSQVEVRTFTGFWDAFSNYIRITYHFMFSVFPDNGYFECFFIMMSWLFTLILSYIDVYLMIMCIPLTFRFRQLERKLVLMIKYKIRDEKHWRNVRIDFVRLSNVCDSTEKCIGHFLVFSIGYKLFAIMLQILGVIRGLGQGEERGLVGKLYIVVSLGIMAIKLVAITMFASSIDLVCQNIIDVLFSVPSDLYNTEIERFIICIKQSQPIISGWKLFQMKKSLILKMASVIVVYELVLINFSKS